jgi:uncharacterized protein YdiU (UPF0061 family)
MNTDNMAISGETIDYGPCAFLDAYDPATVFSSIDRDGRYAFGNQPTVAAWNLARLAESLLPLLDDDTETAVALATQALGGFRDRYDDAWSAGMRAKLGLPDGVAVGALADDLLTLLQAHRADHTAFFRALGAAARGDDARVHALITDGPLVRGWLDRWRAHAPDGAAMDRVNPVYLPRNHLVEEALAAATDGDLAPLHRLVDALSDPYRERPGLERFTGGAPADFGTYRTFCGT